MVPPSVVIKDGMGGRRFARPFSWSAKLLHEAAPGANPDGVLLDTAPLSQQMFETPWRLPPVF
jgi:hypothetical protein